MKKKWCFIGILLIAAILNFYKPAKVTAQITKLFQSTSYVDGDLFELEYNDNYESANDILVNTRYIGNLNTVEDYDYYKFTLDTPGSIFIEFSNMPDLGNKYWNVDLYNVDKNGDKTVLDNIKTGDKAYRTMDKKRLPAGTYYITVSNYNYYYFSNSDYKLKVNFTAESAEYMEQEFNDSFAQSNVIKMGTAYTGNSSIVTDYDYYKFVLDTPGSVLLEFSNMPDMGVKYWSVCLYTEDEYGNKTELDKMETGDKAYRAMDKKRLPAGTYYVTVGNYNYYYYSNSDYKLKVNFSAESAKSFEQEFNNTFQQPNKIILGSTYTGNLSSVSDEDYYKITTNKTLNLLTKLKNTGNTDYKYWAMEIYKEDKYGNKEKLKEYTFGDSTSENIKYFDLAAGTYYIVIKNYNYYYYSNADYQLTVKENKPGKPSTIKVAKATKNSITLSWKKATDATKYQIYRSTNEKSGYKLVATVSGLKFTNLKLTSKKNYYYKIRAINSDGIVGAYSSSFRAKTK